MQRLCMQNNCMIKRCIGKICSISGTRQEHVPNFVLYLRNVIKLLLLCYC